MTMWYQNKLATKALANDSEIYAPSQCHLGCSRQKGLKQKEERHQQKLRGVT